MFTDPISIDHAGAPVSLVRTGSGLNQGTFAGPNGLALRISHTYGKRERSVFRIDSRKIGADPLATGVNREYSASAYLVLDQPVVGYSDTEITDLLNALVDALSVDANLTKFVRGES